MPRLVLVTKGAVGSLSKKIVVVAPPEMMVPSALVSCTVAANGTNGRDELQPVQYTYRVTVAVEYCRMLRSTAVVGTCSSVPWAKEPASGEFRGLNDMWKNFPGVD